MQLEGKNIVVYDLEIKKPVEECTRKWASLDEMGISVGCAYDYRQSRFRVFLDDNMHELVDRLNEPDTIIVAFNHINFDNKLLRAQGFNLRDDRDLRNYDLMQISKQGAGSRGIYDKGFRLEDHLVALGLPNKTANGIMAPLWFKEGKVGKVIDYCLNDVTQEKALFEYFCTHGTGGCAWTGGPARYAITKFSDMWPVNFELSATP